VQKIKYQMHFELNFALVFVFCFNQPKQQIQSKFFFWEKLINKKNKNNRRTMDFNFTSDDEKSQLVCFFFMLPQTFTSWCSYLFIFFVIPFIIFKFLFVLIFIQ